MYHALKTASALLLAAAACSRNPQPTAVPQPAALGAGAPAGAGQAAGQDTAAGARRPGAQEPRPYNRVITAEARTVSGLFKAHRIAERLYFEIPRAEFDKDMLVVARTVAGGASTGFFGGGANLVVRWEREGNRVLLRRRPFDITADSAAAISRAVEALRYGPILASFSVEAWGPDSTAVIEATKLFTTNIRELGGVNNPAADRSFIESVAAYATNINVEATQTGSQTPTAVPGLPTPPGGTQAPTVTSRISWSLLKLPEQPMMPRLRDKRIGFISSRFIDYSRPEHEASIREVIHRFRLDKKDPGAEISDPVSPIVFWIDPATPEWLVPWIRKGVEAWQVAYREAGFSNAITARTAPPAAEDPHWSMFDARHSIIYWRPSTVANATGGQVVDPRSGEIIKAEVNMYHNVMDLLKDWYFTQVAPLDGRARSLPLPDSLMGRLVEYVVTHEVGHAIGYPHNMKASAMYPADSLRSAAFLRRMGGHVSTLMDYSRFNYVAQPEDSIPPGLLIPNVGPYDKFVVMWGHRPIPGARTPDDELPTLDNWARTQDTIPWFRFTTEGSPNDPFNQTEAVGDQDAVKSSTLGMKNLERVAEMLVSVAEKPGRDYTLLDDLYENVVGQWGRYNFHVAAIIGSAETQERYGTGIRFTPTSKRRQQDALRYLNANAFRVPGWLLDADVIRRIEAEGTVARIRAAQASVVGTLINEPRLNRLVEYEALGRPGEAYTIADLLNEMRTGIWGELSASSVRIDVYRRGLQRSYLEAIDRVVYPPRPATPPVVFPGLPAAPRFSSDARPALRGHLLELDRAVQSAIGRAADGMTRLHLRDVHMEIERLLDPKVTR